MKPFFKVAVLTTPLEAETPPGEGLQILEPRLRLRVNAGAPGWQVQVKATHLESDHGDRIFHKEVMLCPAEGSPLPLHEFQTIVSDGPAGENVYEAAIAINTETLPACETYTGELFIGAQHPQGAQSPLIKVPFILHVRCTVTHTLSGQKVYFHFANLPNTQQATMTGSIATDLPVALGLRAMDGRIDELPLLKSLGDTERDPDAAIPMAWRLAQGGQTLRPPDEVSYDSAEIAWLFPRRPEQTPYELTVSLTPAPYQAPGDYGLEVEVSLRPVL